MIENSRKMGDLLLNNLKSMKKDFIKDVRGKVSNFLIFYMKKDTKTNL